MLPTTHYLYLGLTLFAVGLGGALLRRSLIATLLGVELMLVALALALSAYARHFLDPGGQVAAALVVLVGVCELAIVVAVALRCVRVSSTSGEGEGASLMSDWHGGGSG